MIRRALLAAAVLGAWSLAGGAQAQSGLVLGYDPDLTAYLHNNTTSPISFDGYQIASETKQLDPLGWRSIADQVAADPLSCVDTLGAGCLAFGEANPNPASLAELNLAGAATLQPDARLHLGKPFGEGGYWVDFYYKTLGTPNSSEPQHLYIQPVPEPASWVLAGLAGLALAVQARRRCVPEAEHENSSTFQRGVRVVTQPSLRARRHAPNVSGDGEPRSETAGLFSLRR